MVKVWFPNMFMRLVSVNTARNPATANLIVPPSMTKTEVKEYLTKIYNIPVISVTTANFAGKWKRLYHKRQITAYRRRNTKKATVLFDNPKAAEAAEAAAEATA